MWGSEYSPEQHLDRIWYGANDTLYELYRQRVFVRHEMDVSKKG